MNYPLVNIYTTKENHYALGKLTIETGSYVSHYQRLLVLQAN